MGLSLLFRDSFYVYNLAITDIDYHFIIASQRDCRGVGDQGHVYVIDELEFRGFVQISPNFDGIFIFW